MQASRAFDRDKRTRRAVKRQEKDLAKAIGGRRTPASGSLARSKWATGGRGSGAADATSSSAVAEAKLTMKESLSIKAVWLSAVTKQALSRGVMPVVQIEFASRSVARSVVPMRWAIIPWGDFEGLCASREREAAEESRRRETPQS